MPGRYGDLVSVVIPTYNRTESLRRAAASVLAQTYANLELIIVDDASDVPGAQAVAEALDDPRVRFVRREVNGGAGAARNTGVEAAKGDLIAFHDSDDEWLLDKLERVSELAREDVAELAGVL